MDPTPVACPAEDAAILEAAHAFALAQATHAGLKEECDAACAEYQAAEEGRHAELATASEAMAAAQAKLIEASTCHPVIAEKAKVQREAVKKGKR